MNTKLNRFEEGDEFVVSEGDIELFDMRKMEVVLC